MEEVLYRISNFADKYLDISVSVLGFLILLCLDIYIYSKSGHLNYIKAYLILSIIPLFIFLIYPFLKNRISIEEVYNESKINKKLSSIIFFICLVLAIISYLTYPDSFGRPLIFFILVALAITILIGEILYFENQNVYFTLFKIMLLALVIRLIPLTMIPGFYFDDPMYHEAFTYSIIKNNHIPLNTSYSPFPLMHTLLSFIMLESGIGFKFSALSITFLQSTLIILIIFLIGRITLNERLGLVSAALFSFLDVIIGYGIKGAFPTTFAIFPIVIIIYLLFRKNNSIINLIFVLLLFAVVISHSLSALFLLSFLLAFSVMRFFFTKINKFNKLNASAILLFSIITVSYWMYNAEFIFSRFLNMIFMKESGVHASFSTSTGIAYSQTIPILEYLINFAPQVIFFSLGILGFLYICSRFKENQKLMVFITISILFLIIGAGGQILSAAIASDRFIYYTYILLPIASAVGIIILSNLLKKKNLVILLVFILAFTMITNSYSNMDSPLYSQHLTPPRYIMESEITSIQTISNITTSNIFTDNDLSSYLMFIKNKNATMIQFSNGNFTDYRLILLRESFINKPVYSKGMYKLNYDPFIKLENEGYNTIYDSKKLELFINMDIPENKTQNTKIIRDIF